MNKEFENPVPPRSKGVGGRIIEDKAAEARERIGRIEKTASGAAAEAQKAAQEIEERKAEREVAERDVVQQRSGGEKVQASARAGQDKRAADDSGRRVLAAKAAPPSRGLRQRRPRHRPAMAAW